jgi:DNA-directed RNA polymerase specialized sigma24 family protein
MTDPHQASSQDFLGSELQDTQKPRRTHRRRTSYHLTEEDEFLLKALPARQAEILRQDGSLKDISDRLQLPLGTVKSRTHRARAALNALRARAREAAPQ